MLVAPKGAMQGTPFAEALGAQFGLELGDLLGALTGNKSLGEELREALGVELCDLLGAWTGEPLGDALGLEL